MGHYLGWMGKYFGWVGVGGAEWGWAGVNARESNFLKILIKNFCNRIEFILKIYLFYKIYM